jgi:monoterpene epsilon-lactone hydrolase
MATAESTAERRRAFDLLQSLVSKPDATMDDYRNLYDEVCANFVPPADAEISAVDAGGVPALWVAAPGVATDQVVVLLHGGGWCMGNAHGYREFAYRISRAADARVLVADYRLAPEYPFPAPLDDAVAAYRWTAAQPGVRRVAFVGDSAGGGLVVSALLALRDSGGPAPSPSAVCSPLVDLAGEGASLTERAHLDPLPAAALVQAMGGAYLAGRDTKDPLASPLYGDLRGLPALLVLVGSDEGLYDDSVRLVARIQAAGGNAELEVGENMVHIWPIFNFLPEARAATDRIGDFLRKGFAAG